MAFQNFSVLAGPGRSFSARKSPPGYSPLGALGHYYDPDEPRVPAGQPDGGQWTREGRGREATSSAAKPNAPKSSSPRLPSLTQNVASDAPNKWILGERYAAKEGAQDRDDNSQSGQQTAAAAPTPTPNDGISLRSLFGSIADWLDAPAGVGSGTFMVPGTGTGLWSPEIISANPMDYRPEYHDRPFTRGDFVGAALDLASLAGLLRVPAEVARAGMEAWPIVAMQRGRLAEPMLTKRLGSAGKVDLVLTQPHIDSAAFKVIVGKTKYTPTGKPVEAEYDARVGDALAEIKTGRSPLDSSYQLRLQTYGALVNNRPYTIYTSRPVNPSFKDWLTRWGVEVKPLPDKWWWLR